MPFYIEYLYLDIKINACKKDGGKLKSKGGRARNRIGSTWWAIPVGLGLGLTWVTLAGMSMLNSIAPDKKES